MNPEINEKVLILKGTGKHCQATWWLINGNWRCVGAMRAVSHWITDYTPERAMEKAIQYGFRCSLIERHNPDNLAVKASGKSWAETSKGPITVSRHDLKQTHEKITGKTLAVEPGEGGAAQQTSPLTGGVAGSISLQTAVEASRESLVPTAVVLQRTELCSR